MWCFLVKLFSRKQQIAYGLFVGCSLLFLGSCKLKLEHMEDDTWQSYMLRNHTLIDRETVKSSSGWSYLFDRDYMQAYETFRAEKDKEETLIKLGFARSAFELGEVYRLLANVSETLGTKCNNCERRVGEEASFESIDISNDEQISLSNILTVIERNSSSTDSLRIVSKVFYEIALKNGSSHGFFSRLLCVRLSMDEQCASPTSEIASWPMDLRLVHEYIPLLFSRWSRFEDMRLDMDEQIPVSRQVDGAQESVREMALAWNEYNSAVTLDQGLVGFYFESLIVSAAKVAQIEGRCGEALGQLDKLPYPDAVIMAAKLGLAICANQPVMARTALIQLEDWDYKGLDNILWSLDIWEAEMRKNRDRQGSANEGE